MTIQITYSAIDSHQFQIIYYIKVCNKCSLSLILNKRNDLIFLITRWTIPKFATLIFDIEIGSKLQKTLLKPSDAKRVLHTRSARQTVI